MNLTSSIVIIITLVCCLSGTSESCSCLYSHPQEHFCSADFVVLANVKRPIGRYVGRNSPSSSSYMIKVKREFKMSFRARKSLDAGFLYTSSSEASCGRKFEPNTRYLITGRVIGEKAWVSLCNYAEKWSDLTNKQKRGFRQSYGESCICKVRENQLQPSIQFSFHSSPSSSPSTIRYHVTNSYNRSLESNNNQERNGEEPRIIQSVTGSDGKKKTTLLSAGRNDSGSSSGSLYPTITRNSCHWKTKWDSHDCQSLYSICKPMPINSKNDENEVVGGAGDEDDAEEIMNQSNIKMKEKMQQNEQESPNGTKGGNNRRIRGEKRRKAIKTSQEDEQRFFPFGSSSHVFLSPIRRAIQKRNQRKEGSSLLSPSSALLSESESSFDSIECRWVSSLPYRECMKNRAEGSNPNGSDEDGPVDWDP